MKRSTPRGTRRSGGSALSSREGLAAGTKSARFVEAIGPADDALEHEAEKVADAVMQGGLPRSAFAWSAASGSETVQRKCAECEQEEEEQIRRAPMEGGASAASATASAAASSSFETAAAAETEADTERDTAGSMAREQARSGPLIVDDEADASARQLRKSEFLATLRKEICATVDAALVATGRDSQGCPWIDHWLGYYEGRSAAQMEQALIRYAPEAAGAATARDYVQFVTVRVGRSAEKWARTGELEGMPSDIPASAALGGGVLGAFGGMFFKALPGGARPSDPVSVRAELGSGQPLPTAVRSRMEPAFGVSFSGVRLHDDASAAHLAGQMNARAFTLGRDVAFGAGEYRPGTLVGDALIAHELAHVVQQGGSAARGPQTKSGPADSALERDADAAAVSAVSAALDPKGRSGGFARASRPRLQSSLRLQRCGSSTKKPVAPSLETDKALRQRWEDAFQDGVKLLDKSISEKGERKGCSFTFAKPKEQWRFDETNWRKIIGEEETRKYRIAYVPRKKPHESVDELFKHLERWECDCALFTELTWLYAWRHTLSDDDFDAKFSNLRLRPHETEGFGGELQNRESFEMGLQRGNFDALWDSAPVGTKVNWVNESQHAREPWTHENAVKTKKGATPDQDLYYAHPMGKDKTEAQVKRELAENSEDFPGKPFVITDDTLNAVKGEGAPAEFVKGLAALKGQVIIGRPAFWKAIAQAQQTLIPLKQANEQQYAAIRAKLFETAHLPATEAEKRTYVATFIKRNDLTVPK